MDIKISLINHEQQKYPTVGDWRFRVNETLEIKVSKMANWKFELLVAIHELIEAALCKHSGIDVKVVEDFDEVHELLRVTGDDSEPGDNPSAPYHKEHVFATEIEKQCAQELGVNWEEYSEKVSSL